MSGEAGHWSGVYEAKDDAQTSWFEPSPDESLAMLDSLGIGASDAVVDVGAGTSRLVDALIGRGHREVAVLDIAAEALERSQVRLGDASRSVEWIVADVTEWRPARRYRVWHDRAVFHFLTHAADQEAYGRTMRSALEPGGIFVVATFAPSGPESCSGLPVARYDAESLTRALGPGIEMLEQRDTEHRTPWGASQPFTWLAGRVNSE